MTMLESSRRQWLQTAVVLGYAALVLTVDTLAAAGVSWPFHWSRFHIQSPNGVDVFKFVAWFVIPFIFCLPTMDWGYFGFNRWKKRDYAFLAVMAGLGLLAVVSIKFIPSLQHVYGGGGGMSWDRAQRSLVWTFSWLVGWEFLHRYFILTHVQKRWRHGWLIVPVFEGVYHLQKPLLEAGGMVVFSLLLTSWAVKRRNALLPFIAHLAVEVELILFMLYA